jgi:hypothetical protein
MVSLTYIDIILTILSQQLNDINGELSMSMVARNRYGMIQPIILLSIKTAYVANGECRRAAQMVILLLNTTARSCQLNRLYTIPEAMQFSLIVSIPITLQTI